LGHSFYPQMVDEEHRTPMSADVLSKIISGLEISMIRKLATVTPILLWSSQRKTL
jgi:hypothetical protein